MIAVRYPDDGVIGEEHGIGSGDWVWVVDPIDGTKNFADGVPIWATLLALQVDGRSVLGIASAPALGERYEATQGGGAWNGQGSEPAGAPRSRTPSWSSRASTTRSAPLVAGVPGPPVRVAPEPRVRRLLGAHARGRGAADFMIEPELRIWDWASVVIIVEEAGGRVTTFGGDPPPTARAS